MDLVDVQGGDGNGERTTKLLCGGMVMANGVRIREGFTGGEVCASVVPSILAVSERTVSPLKRADFGSSYCTIAVQFIV